MKQKLVLILIFSVLNGYAGYSQSPKAVHPVLTRGPYLQSATPTSIIIRWRTDVSERSVVRYGTHKDSLTVEVENPKLTTEHIVELKGLKPRTRYYYSIGGLIRTLQAGEDNFFVTLPVAGEKGVYRIGAFGDCGNNSANQKDIKDQFLKYLGDQYMDAWILLGDNAYESGTDAEYQHNFFTVYKDDLLKKYPLYPAPGNHDYRDISKYRGVSQRTHEVAYYQNFSMPINGEAGGVASGNPAYYSFDIGNIHFISLDSYGQEEGALRMYDTLSPQVQWVKKDLEANKNRDWVVAYWHHPPYTMGSHNSDKENELVKIRENFIRILERYGVDLILCGHSHSYERSKLLQGHYGPEASFQPANHVLNASSGAYDGTAQSCPYIKGPEGKGTVYVVSGSAGKLDPRVQTSFPHEALPYANATHGGALMLEVADNRLDLKWICADGVIRDAFTMMKNVNRKTTLRAKKGQSIMLTASFTGKYRWEGAKGTTRSILVTPREGKTTYKVRDEYSCLEETFEVIVSK